MPKRACRALVAGVLLIPALAWTQGHAHEHGALTLDIAVEAGAVIIELSSPLDSLVGFERAPRSDAERQRVGAVLSSLRAAQELFVVDPTAQCRVAKVDIVSALLGLGAPRAEGAKEQHADLSATVDFRCKDAARAAYVDVRLFDAFAGMKRIDVQVAGPHGQFKRTLKRPERRIALTR